MQDLLGKKRFWLVLGLSLIVPFIATYAQDDDDDDDDDDEQQEEQVEQDDWQTKREEIAKAIRIEIDRRVREKVTHESIVARIKQLAIPYEKELAKELKRQRDNFFDSEVRKWDNLMLPSDVHYPRVPYQPKQVPDWTAPVPVPAKKLETLKDEMEKELDALFTKAYPMKTKDEFEAEGREKYKLKVISEETPRPFVSFKLR